MTNQINASLLCLFQSNKGRATDGFALVYSKLRLKFPTLHAQKPRQCKLPEAEIVHRFLFTFSAFFGFLRFYFFFFFFLLHFVINTVPFAVTVYYHCLLSSITSILCATRQPYKLYFSWKKKIIKHTRNTA